MSIRRTPADPKADHNRELTKRAHLVLESWLEDALTKHDFFGSVQLEVSFQGGRIVGINPIIRQTIKV